MLNRWVRLLKHRWMDDASRVIAPDVLQRLGERVAASERQHTGEVRICIEAGLPNSYLLRPDPIRALTRQRALNQFGKLRVWDTEDNNGVLIYLLLAERAIELVADRGLNTRVSPEDWRNVVGQLQDALRRGHFEAGLTQAVDAVSAILTAHFPVTPGAINPNELPDHPELR